MPVDRPPYKNALLITGALLLVLGAGNWIIGSTRVEPYAEYLRRYPGPPRDGADLKSELLAPPDERREERSVSRAKLEYYGLVRSGGRLMALIGALCLLVGSFTQRGGGTKRPPGLTSLSVKNRSASGGFFP